MADPRSMEETVGPWKTEGSNIIRCRASVLASASPPADLMARVQWAHRTEAAAKALSAEGFKHPYSSMMRPSARPLLIDQATLPSLERLRLANELIGEMWTTSMTALVGVLGDERSVRYLRPHYRANMREECLHLAQQLGMDKGSLLTLGYIMNLGSATAGLKARTEVAERSVTLTVYECPFGHSGQEAFCKLHTLLFDSVLEELETDYVDRRVMCRSRGDPFCQHVMAPRSALPGERPEEGRAVMVLAEPLLPPEAMLEIGARFASNLWISTVQALSDAIGGYRTLSVLRPLMRKLGHASGLRYMSILGLGGDDEDDLAKVVSLLHEIMHQPTVGWQTDDGFEETLGSCPYEDSPDEVHKLCDALAEGVCQAVRPDCLLIIDRGDGVPGACRWSVRCPRRLCTIDR